MKYLIFCVVIAITAAEIYANYPRLFALGTRISISSRATTTCSKSGPICSDDCSTLLICGSSPTPLQTTNCSSPNQYCVGSTCTNQPSVNCTSAPAFTCTANGIFPEPSNCTQYRECVGANATLYQCPPGFIFDSVNIICTASNLGRTTAPTVACSTINCSKSPNGFIVYPSNPAYYAYCASVNGQITTYMYACDYPEFQIFDTVSNTCIFNCKAKGNFQDPSNCQNYFYCSAAKAKPTLLACPTNYVFDGADCNKNNSTCQYPPTAAAAPPADTPAVGA